LAALVFGSAVVSLAFRLPRISQFQLHSVNCAVNFCTARPQYKEPSSSVTTRTIRRRFRGSKLKGLRSWPLHLWSTSEATLVGISRAYRLIRFRCQQAPLKNTKKQEI